MKRKGTLRGQINRSRILEPHHNHISRPYFNIAGFFSWGLGECYIRHFVDDVVIRAEHGLPTRDFGEEAVRGARQWMDGICTAISEASQPKSILYKHT